MVFRVAQTWVKENNMPLGTEKAVLLGSGSAGPPDVVEYLVQGGGGGASGGTHSVNLGSAGAGGIPDAGAFGAASAGHYADTQSGSPASDFAEGWW